MVHCYHLSDHFVAGAREVKDHVAAVVLAGWGSRFARRFALRQRSRRRSGRRWWRRLGRSRLGQLCCRLSQPVRLLLRRLPRLHRRRALHSRLERFPWCAQRRLEKGRQGNDGPVVHGGRNRRGGRNRSRGRDWRTPSEWCVLSSGRANRRLLLLPLLLRRLRLCCTRPNTTRARRHGESWRCRRRHRRRSCGGRRARLCPVLLVEELIFCELQRLLRLSERPLRRTPLVLLRAQRLAQLEFRLLDRLQLIGNGAQLLRLARLQRRHLRRRLCLCRLQSRHLRRRLCQRRLGCPGCLGCGIVVAVLGQSLWRRLGPLSTTLGLEGCQRCLRLEQSRLGRLRLGLGRLRLGLGRLALPHRLLSRIVALLLGTQHLILLRRVLGSQPRQLARVCRLGLLKRACPPCLRLLHLLVGRRRQCCRLRHRRHLALRQMQQISGRRQLVR